MLFNQLRFFKLFVDREKKLFTSPERISKLNNGFGSEKKLKLIQFNTVLTEEKD